MQDGCPSFPKKVQAGERIEYFISMLKSGYSIFQSIQDILQQII